MKREAILVGTLLGSMLAGICYAAPEVCCADLGCFNNDGWFHVINRPISSLPNCDHLSRFRLHLNTRSNPDTTTIIDPYRQPSITESGFQFDKDTKIIVHGFTDNYAWSWWADVKTAYLEDADVNVIRVYWSTANTPPLVQAAANARLLGAYVAKFVKLLRSDYNYSPSRVHLIGHSLGAQVVGYIGADVGKNGTKVARITGIDPAGMYFQNMPNFVRLDPSDAEVVDTIVTDAGSILQMAFGSTQNMGHLNFHVNGGSDQPGCDQSLISTIISGPTSFNTSSFDTAATVTQTGYQAVMCNHYRALAVFTETINRRKCPLTAYHCSSYAEFLQGKCFTCKNGGCSKLGEHQNSSLAENVQQKTFYTFTTDRPSYCTNAYRLKFKLQGKNVASDSREEEGHVYLTLQGSQGFSSRFQLTAEETEFKPGQEYGFLFHTPQQFGSVVALTFEWDARFNILNPTEWIRRHYLFIDGNLELTTQDEVTTYFRLPSNRVEEEKPVRANLVSRF
ncbi:pancreatic triacylglycerol lipase-like [Paramacrobiotus metropolitanus]|uniref:pancreatic triacylglycerol lipase-like n=1 Tax=Paramacrobiotus metropolitanus TaxID=2943436 RepID=UPI0024465237|nr:pancreatic triacylglycerol lipase-like [Paramacrobiotus metropolitanus]